ncbi:MAG: hypothetical protein ACQEXQ_21695 [Bacillota bacterium]
MKIKFELLLVIILLLLAGCTKTDKPVDPFLLNIGQVEDSFRSTGMEMNPKQITDDWILKKTKANRYVVVNHEIRPLEQIFIYIFDSVDARKDGHLEFIKQKEKYKMAVADIYERKNVMVIYWTHSDDIDNRQSRFGNLIDQALQKL